MSGVFFLTEMDPRLQVQGSRDALGAQGLWGTIGRRLVGNLTLSSNDAAGFRTLLMGYGLTDGGGDVRERLRVFLRWEQVAAGARVAVEDARAPLGARRVRRRLASRTTMTISEDHPILADQRSAGLWVLYHRAARESGLVDDRRRLTETGRRLVDGWLEQLPQSVLRKVRQQGPQQVSFGRVGEPTAESGQIAAVVVDGDRSDRSILNDTLVRGVVSAGGQVRRLTDGCQEHLADLLATEHIGDNWYDRLPDLIKRADTEVAGRLRDVMVTESVLHPAQAAFDALLLDGNGAAPSHLAEQVSRTWPKVPASVQVAEFDSVVAPRLRPRLGDRRSDLWVDVAKAMAEGDWERALERLVEVNGDAMERRGGAPWVRCTARGTLDVRLPLGAPLPAPEVLYGWRNPYYLTPLVSVQRDLLPGGRR